LLLSDTYIYNFRARSCEVHFAWVSLFDFVYPEIGNEKLLVNLDWRYSPYGCHSWRRHHVIGTFCKSFILNIRMIQPFSFMT
jgi:hypothetical protein